jgi:hypothetical protein
MADSLLEVRRFSRTRFEDATAQDAVTGLLERMALTVHSGNDTSDLAPDHETHRSRSSPLNQFVVICHCMILWSDEY